MKLISFILGLIVFQSSFGTYFSKHYCGGEFRYVSFYGESDGCDMTGVCTLDHSTADGSEHFNNNCCRNDHVYISSLEAQSKVEENQASDMQPLIFPLYFNLITYADAAPVIENEHPFIQQTIPKYRLRLPVLNQNFRL